MMIKLAAIHSLINLHFIYFRRFVALLISSHLFVACCRQATGRDSVPAIPCHIHAANTKHEICIVVAPDMSK